MVTKPVLQECQVLTVSSTAQVTDKLKLQLSIGANGYLVKVGVVYFRYPWLPLVSLQGVLVAWLSN